MDQELNRYGTFEIYTLTEIKDTIINLNNKTTVVKRELLNKKERASHSVV